MRSVFLVTAAVLLSVGRGGCTDSGQGRDHAAESPGGEDASRWSMSTQSAEPGVQTKITDPYRWLEDAHSPETRAFITAQNAYTAQYFSQVKMLPRGR